MEIDPLWFLNGESYIPSPSGDSNSICVFVFSKVVPAKSLLF
jgi:hypothetical protein